MPYKSVYVPDRSLLARLLILGVLITHIIIVIPIGADADAVKVCDAWLVLAVLVVSELARRCEVTRLFILQL